MARTAKRKQAAPRLSSVPGGAGKNGAAPKRQPKPKSYGAALRRPLKDAAGKPVEADTGNRVGDVLTGALNQINLAKLGVLPVDQAILAKRIATELDGDGAVMLNEREQQIGLWLAQNTGMQPFVALQLFEALGGQIASDGRG